MTACDIAIIGGGPAGLAAAAGAWEAGARDILVLERDVRLGGILNQCIHNGFGLHRFKEELTGPEYAQRDIAEIHELGITPKLETMVLGVSPDRVVTAVNPRDGVMEIRAGAIVLTMGCRERPRGPINIHGTRPAGIFTAGTAQKYVNIHGFMPGREVVVLGSGDIGLIMARRMTLEGARVRLVAELMPYSAGLRRNIAQCLDDFNIPLRYSTTVVEVSGRERLESVTLARVDENLRPIALTREVVPCDTLLLSVGLIPENELAKLAGVDLSPVTGGARVGESFQTSVPGIFACGNALHVHDLVDFVSEESRAAGRHAAAFVGGKRLAEGGMEVAPGRGVRYTVPVWINPANLEGPAIVRFRVDNQYKGAKLCAYLDDEPVRSVKKMIMTPGEMESIRLDADLFAKHPGAGRLTLAVED